MDEIQKAKRDAEIEAKVKELQAQFPDREIVTFSSDYAWAAFKIPSGTEYDRYRSMAGPGKMGEANKTLLVTCLAWPDKARFAEIVDKRPHFIEKWADKLTDAAGAAEEIEVKNHSA